MQFRLNIALKIVHATPLYRWVGKKETLQREYCSVYSAEREGFEPPDPRRSTVFKTAAFDRSAIFPIIGQLFTRLCTTPIGFANIRSLLNMTKKSWYYFVKMQMKGRHFVFFLYICTIEMNKPKGLYYYIRV